jgi:hypothetical protein
MTEWQERPVGTIAFAASSKGTLDIPRDNPIRRIIMRFRFGLTTGASAPTYKEDDILNLITKIRLVMEGNENKFNISGRLWWFLEKFEKKTKPYYVAPPTAISTTADSIVTLIADFATDRTDENDITALLMAQDMGSLKLEIDWGASTDLASANAPTINASECTVEIREALAAPITVDPQTRQYKIGDRNLRDIREIQDSIPLSASKTSYDSSSVAANVTPTNATIMTHLLLVRVASNNTKSDALVTSIKLQREKGGKFPIIERAYNLLREETKPEYSQETLDTGILYLDWVDKLEGGLISTGNEGDLKIRMLTSATVASNDEVQLMIRTTQPAVKRKG